MYPARARTDDTPISRPSVVVAVPDSFCPATEAISCAGDHTLTQANVDSISISNTAVVTASPPAATSESIVSAEDTHIVSWALYPALSVGENAFTCGLCSVAVNIMVGCSLATARGKARKRYD